MSINIGTFDPRQGQFWELYFVVKKGLFSFFEATGLHEYFPRAAESIPMWSVLSFLFFPGKEKAVQEAVHHLAPVNRRVPLLISTGWLN